MKSVFITFIIFVVLFALLDSGIISVISSSAFHYAVYALFVMVIGAGVYFVGLPNKKNKAEGEKNDEK